MISHNRIVPSGSVPVSWYPHREGGTGQDVGCSSGIAVRYWFSMQEGGGRREGGASTSYKLGPWYVRPMSTKRVLLPLGRYAVTHRRQSLAWVFADINAKRVCLGRRISDPARVWPAERTLESWTAHRRAGRTGKRPAVLQRRSIVRGVRRDRAVRRFFF